MTEREHMLIVIEEFSRLQRYMKKADKGSELYDDMKMRYIELKSFLADSGVNMTELDIIKE